jgi:hypothetical protein
MAVALRAEFDAFRARTQGQSPMERLQALRALQVEMAGRMAAEAAAHPDLVAKQMAAEHEEKQSLADELGMHGLNPPIDKRLKRLEAMGGHVAAGSGNPGPHSFRSRLALYGFLSVLIGLVGGLMAVAFGMIAALAGAANFFLALPVLLLASWLVGGALH